MSESLAAIAKAIWGTLESPSEMDRNLESANVVDGLFAIARSIGDLADAIRESGQSKPTEAKPPANMLHPLVAVEAPF